MTTKKFTVFDNDGFEKSLKRLEEIGIRFVKSIDKGKYGTVVEVKHANYSENLAAKFVISSKVTIGERIIWKNLYHENIVPLLEPYFFKDLKTSIFLMPAYKATIFSMIKNENFRKSPSSFSRLISWLRNVTTGLAYLHDRGICHLDVKSNNVLIDDSDVALLSDFGFATKPLSLVSKYGIPPICRPPDATNTPEGLSFVDGFALDKWTIGILAEEMFTCYALQRSVKSTDVKWARDVYPPLHSILQGDRFKTLLNAGYLNLNVSAKIVSDALDVIKCFLSINPNDRPELKDVLKYPLFGGTNTPPSADDVWLKKADMDDMENLICKYAPNPLRGVEEQLEKQMEILKKQFATPGIFLHANEEQQPEETKSNESLSTDHSYPITEESSAPLIENENVPKKKEKKKRRRRQVYDWFRKKGSSLHELFRSCIPRCISRK